MHRFIQNVCLFGVVALLTSCATTTNSLQTTSAIRQAIVEEPIGEELARVSVTIDVPSSFLWDFLADNSKARQWSVFFYQILDLPPSTSNSGAGGLGARRRCYRNENERGYYWDEEVVHSIPGRLKRIYTFNVSNDSWPQSWFSKGSETYTDNIYTQIGTSRTKFTFATTSLSATSALTRKLLQVGGHIDLLIEIFILNLENIKFMAEAEFQSSTYVRPHPYSLEYYVGDLDRPVPATSTTSAGKLTDSEHQANLIRFPVNHPADQ